MNEQNMHVRNGIGVVTPFIYGRLALLDFVRQVFGAIEIGTQQNRQRLSCLSADWRFRCGVIGDGTPIRGGDPSLNLCVRG